jgi:hypothetical protein
LTSPTRSGRFLTDHTIYDPCNASGASRSSVSAQEHQHAQVKRRKYTEMLNYVKDSTRQLDTTFVPLVFSALGKFSKEALDFFKLTTAAADPVKLARWPTGPKGFVTSFINAVSCAIQRGNAHIFFSAATVALQLHHSAPAAADRAR